MTRKFSSLKMTTFAVVIALVLTGGVATTVTSSLFTLGKIQLMGEMWKKFDRLPVRKSILLNSVRGLIGYDGMIHNFNNFILRRDRRWVIKIHRSLLEVTIALTAYRALGLNEQEEAALADLDGVLSRYHDAVTVAEKMIIDGETAPDIDRAVNIDDGPAIAAMRVLDRELLWARRTYSAAIDETVRRLTTLDTAAMIVSTFVLVVVSACLIVFIRRHANGYKDENVARREAEREDRA